MEKYKDCRNNMKKIIDGIQKSAAENIKKSDSDYIGEDGMMFCGNCHTQKQIRVVMPFGEIQPYVLCKCETEKRDQKRAEFEAKQREKRINDLRSEGIPDIGMRDWRFENALDRENKIMCAMNRYVDNFRKFRNEGKGVLLYGNVGTGKTYLSACIANALIDKEIPVMMTSITRIANKLMSMYEGKNEYIDNLNRYPLLILDDLAAERNTEYMNEIVYTVIDARYRAKLPMIVTTNLTSDQLKDPPDVASARTYSRVLEMCHPIKVEEIDIRRQKAKDDFKSMRDVLGL